MIERKIICSVCGRSEIEQQYGFGFPGWGHIGGVRLNGVEQPNLCPQHLAEMMNFVEHMVIHNQGENF